jgi:pyruvate dehydrogenase (quinone)
MTSDEPDSGAPPRLRCTGRTSVRPAQRAILTGIGYDAPRIVPQKGDLERAARVLNAGKKVAILVGAGALKAGDEVVEVAEKLGAGVAKALLGKAALPDDLPFVTGSIGLLGTRPSYDMMMGCDTLFMIGSRFPTQSSCPRKGRRAACRSTLTRAWSASAIRWR